MMVSEILVSLTSQYTRPTKQLFSLWKKSNYPWFTSLVIRQGYHFQHTHHNLNWQWRYITFKKALIAYIFKKYVCLSIFYFQQIYDFTERNSLLKSVILFKPESACEARMSSWRGEAKTIPYPSPPNTLPLAQTRAASGLLSFSPHEPKSLHSPATGDAQKAQSGSFGFWCQDTPHSPFSHFPPPTWCQGMGKEEPKPCWRPQNALRGQVQVSLCHFRLCNPPQRVPAEAKGITAVNNATISAIKRKIKVTEAVLISTHRSLVVRAGLASSGSRLSRSNKKQNNTNSMILQAEILWKKQCWKAHLGNSGSSSLCRASESVMPPCKIFTTQKDVFSLTPWVNTGYFGHKRAIIGFMARLLMVS